MSLIECESVSLSYGSEPVVENLSFSVESGDYLCVVGENGAGKTTLIRGLLGMIAPTRGRITYGEGLHRTQIGYMPQLSRAQRDFPASVREVVISGRQGARGIKPFYSVDDRKAAREAMERLGIEKLEKRCYRELSGGQQQRALLARALLATGRLLLLDEPAASLDPVASSELYATIADLNKNSGVAVIMVSHDIGSAAREAGKILHLAATGIFFGSTRDYLESPIGKRFLGGGGQ